MSSSNAIIKKNLERLIKERGWRIVDLENRAQKGRVIHNIMKGGTPRVDIIKSLADALNVDIEEFLYDYEREDKVNISLLLDNCTAVITTITPFCEDYSIKLSNVLRLIKEAYQYSVDMNLPHADVNHIKWLIRRAYTK